MSRCSGSERTVSHSSAVAGRPSCRLRLARVGHEQEERDHEHEVPDRRQRPDEAVAFARGRVEREQRLEPEQRLSRLGRRHDEPGDEREADEAAEVAAGPAGARQPAELALRHEARHDGVGEHRGELGARPSRTRRRRGRGGSSAWRRAGVATHSVAMAAARMTENSAIHGLRCPRPSAKRAEERAADRDEDAGDGRGVAPHRLPARRRRRRRRWRSRGRTGRSGSACRTAAPTSRTASTRCGRRSGARVTAS